MKRFWKIAAIVAVVVVLGTAAVAAVAVAQEGTAGVKDRLTDLGQQFKEAVAGILGISVEEYDTALNQARDQVLDKAVAEGNLTQNQADRIRERAEAGFGPGMMGGGFGPGMTVAELQTQLKDGKTIADLASEKGVDLQTIVDAFMATRQEALSQAVSDGKITQAQADQMLQNMREMVEDHLNGQLPMSGPGGCGGFGERGRGMMGAWDGDDL